MSRNWRNCADPIYYVHLKARLAASIRGENGLNSISPWVAQTTESNPTLAFLGSLRRTSCSLTAVPLSLWLKDGRLRLAFVQALRTEFAQGIAHIMQAALIGMQPSHNGMKGYYLMAFAYAAMPKQ